MTTTSVAGRSAAQHTNYRFSFRLHLCAVRVCDTKDKLIYVSFNLERSARASSMEFFKYSNTHFTLCVFFVCPVQQLTINRFIFYCVHFPNCYFFLRFLRFSIANSRMRTPIENSSYTHHICKHEYMSYNRFYVQFINYESIKHLDTASPFFSVNWNEHYNSIQMPLNYQVNDIMRRIVNVIQLCILP